MSLPGSYCHDIDESWRELGAASRAGVRPGMGLAELGGSAVPAEEFQALFEAVRPNDHSQG